MPDEPSLELPSLKLPRLFPRLSGRVAAALTGLWVGLLGAGLTWTALQGCEQLRGTDSCGGPGVLVLFVVLVLTTLAGAALLAAWRVADPTATSALGVGIACVVVLLVLIPDLFDPWMFLAVPVVGALAFTFAHWIATALVDPTDLDPPPPGPYDIR